MKNFRKKWENIAVEDNGCYMSKEAVSFVTAMRNMLKRELGPFGIEVVSLKPGHYDCSGFLKKGNDFIYVSYSIPRGGYGISFSASDCIRGVLYRKAEGPKDFHGGPNNFCSLEDLPGAIINMFSHYDGGGRYPYSKGRWA